MNICINALFAKSQGILSYGDQIIKNLNLYYPDISITILVNKNNLENFQKYNEICTIWMAPFKRYILNFLYLNVFSLRKLQSFDIIHSIANIGILFPPKPQCITIHDTYEQVSPERFIWIKRFIMAKMIIISGYNSSKIIAVSHNTRHDIEKYYSHLTKKTITIYSGCSYPVGRKIKRTKKNYFIFVGTIEPGKNLLTVIKAMREYIKTNESDRLKIIGNMGWKQSYLYGMLKDFHLTERVDMVGFISSQELINEYKYAKALILASLYEGFGLPIIEAMACGCPVLAARNSSIPEAGGRAALYFNTMDYTALAKIMKSLDCNHSSYKKLISRGLSQARKFDWNNTVKQLCAVYQDMYHQC